MYTGPSLPESPIRPTLKMKTMNSLPVTTKFTLPSYCMSSSLDSNVAENFQNFQLCKCERLALISHTHQKFKIYMAISFQSFYTRQLNQFSFCLRFLIQVLEEPEKGSTGFLVSTIHASTFRLRNWAFQITTLPSKEGKIFLSETFFNLQEPQLELLGKFPTI